MLSGKIKRKRLNLVSRYLQIVGVLLMIVPFVLVFYAFFDEALDNMDEFGHTAHMGVVFIYVIIYYAMRKTYTSNISSLSTLHSRMVQQIIICLMTNVLMYAVLVLLLRQFPDPLSFVLVFGSQVVTSYGWIYLEHYINTLFNPLKNTVLIYEHYDKRYLELMKAEEIASEFKVTWEMEIKGYDRDPRDFFEDLGDADCVFLFDVDRNHRNPVINYCRRKGIEVYMTPTLTDVMLSGSQTRHLSYKLFYQVGQFEPSPEYRIAKRAFDIFASFLALVLLSPLFLVTAIAIKVTDHGPVFYKQVRLTLNGKPFRIVKFRSMRTDAEKDGKARLSTGTNDDRVTPVGKIIRKFRIDELPQLINILKGDMSFVGPRPERPEIVAEYLKDLPEFDIRLEARAGLTGYAQVFAKYNATPEEKLQLDMMYIKHQTLLGDLKILFQTVKIVITPEATEGVSEGQITAKR